MKRPPLRLFPHQQEMLKSIASWAGIPLRGGERATTPSTTRFNTTRLASKLTSALQQKTTGATVRTDR